MKWLILFPVKKESISAYVREKMNRWGKSGRPFLFVLDFALQQPEIFPLDEISNKDILFDIQGVKNFSPAANTKIKPADFRIYPVSKDRYCQAFNQVQKYIRRGDTFLLNLTMPHRIDTHLNLKQLFFNSKAKYKIWFRDRFVCFSPEIFIQTQSNLIRSFPMKGTIDARIKNAREKLLASPKERAEHFTIVDLIRNDLSIVAKNVKVNRFRYIDHIQTHKNDILQMSSEIEGTIRPEFKKSPGDLLFALLPAGSISGAPKKKTLEIIRETEKYDRGFYTGIMGIFDGQNINSGVMIRFIEKTEKGLVYKSGGGITALSNCEEEYNELIDKIYVPFH
ncbi:aminodeoxychorismate synthase component I [Candidatus Sulfidibacterium hydrothermale]|uniref:aminodeoxychorismate synthase component I n=1 Tax=Candidatus Sulfidibacterium hydrothermale TaxID=2875962 RepID=UPI001F0A49F9|nr:aminodeoxychorismate synthase component I [Candidatus Sulfidibacterium hydrothermale]UBM62220.1 aminodeoxychorismate synthase component I [Candidatus Sulfidibacterium hydrothermale]